MKKTSLFVLSLFLLAHEAQAEKMANGCEITESTDSQGNPTYLVESQGRTVTWLKQAESGKYNNMPDEEDVNSSLDAVRACENKGLNLPSKEDFEALQKCFEADKSNDRLLSDKGLRDLYEKFPDMANRAFWSSSLSSDKRHPNGVFYFSGRDGIILHDGLYGRGSVRCVVNE